MVVIGGKSVEDTKKGARRIARAVQKATTSARIYCGKIELHNIAAYMNVGYRINILALFDSRRFNSYYEPEFFSPAVKCFYSKSEKLIALVFRSGKVILTGSTDYEKICDFRQILLRTLLKFKQ
jgi:TATA-box binding protein (TBP) (component of TFIID and TFIIIB)